MHTLKLNISDSIYENLMFLLRRFDASEVEIIQEDYLQINKEYLTKELDMVRSNQAEYVSSKELNKSIDDVISKYED